MAKNAKNYDAILSCPFGGIALRLEGPSLTSVDFIYKEINENFFSSRQAESVAKKILKYFKNPCANLLCDIQVSGTDFQKKVWQQLQQIPPGQVRTYGELAAILKSSPRAIGNACRKNPTPLVVPCHRVVAKSGIGGFSGQVDGKEIAVKQWLLDFEARCA